jgi:hypothetical protein
MSDKLKKIWKWYLRHRQIVLSNSKKILRRQPKIIYIETDVLTSCTLLSSSFENGHQPRTESALLQSE